MSCSIPFYRKNRELCSNNMTAGWRARWLCNRQWWPKTRSNTLSGDSSLRKQSLCWGRYGSRRPTRFLQVKDYNYSSCLGDIEFLVEQNNIVLLVYFILLLENQASIWNCQQWANVDDSFSVYENHSTESLKHLL